MKGTVFYLYRYNPEFDVKSGLKPKVYHSRFLGAPFSKITHGKTTKEYNDFFTELRWRVASKNHLDIYYLCKGTTIVHSSFCTPKSFKFPFMKENDYHIGPCFTDRRYRGKAIYPRVLKYIADEINDGENKIYMIISEDNISSRNGVKKAGFEEVALLKRTKFLRRYYVKEWL